MRAQAALEFMTTYGWAIMVMLIMVGGVTYYGVLDVKETIPGKCVSTPEFGCTEHKVEQLANGTVRVYAGLQPTSTVGEVNLTARVGGLELPCTNPGRVRGGTSVMIICQGPGTVDEIAKVELEGTYLPEDKRYEQQIGVSLTAQVEAVVAPAGPSCPADKDCSGLSCGPDLVCGLECGPCVDPTDACTAGVCVPAGPSCPADKDCTGLSCGPDLVCGLECGPCVDPTDACTAGVCVPAGPSCPADKDCTGLSCGPDLVCGLECGPCVDPTDACTAGVCVPAPICGDSNVDTGIGEECDDGADGDDLDGCTDLCAFTTCLAAGGALCSSLDTGETAVPAGTGYCDAAASGEQCVTCGAGYSADNVPGAQGDCNRMCTGIGSLGGHGCTDYNESWENSFFGTDIENGDNWCRDSITGAGLPGSYCVSCSIGYHWDLPTRECVPDCVSDCVTPWTTFQCLDSLTPQICADMGDSCYQWQNGATCSGGFTCASGTGQCTCGNEVRDTGEFCDGSSGCLGAETCNAECSACVLAPGACNVNTDCTTFCLPLTNAICSSNACFCF